jgi:putative transposase
MIKNQGVNSWIFQPCVQCGGPANTFGLDCPECQRRKRSAHWRQYFPDLARRTVNQAYKFALRPTSAQEQLLASHAGANRFAWNWGLAKCKERLEAEGKLYSKPELNKLWNVEKKADPDLAWWPENCSHAYGTAFDDLEEAFRAFFKSRKGERKGQRVGFPRFKSKGKCRDSFRYGQKIRCGDQCVMLPRIGTVRTHEPTDKLTRKLEAGIARVLSATVSRTAQRWFVSLTVEVERDIPAQHPRPGTAIGIDLGVKTLLTGYDSTGTVVTVPGPKALRASLRRLRRANKALHRKQLGSANRRKAARRVARVHARVANVRTDALHKATSELARQYETVVLEDLNVAGMVRNRHLARAIMDQGFGRARQMLSYKTTWNSGTLVTADRYFPSSKTCSGCGVVKAKLLLSERRYVCTECGLAIDRDVNAAVNLLKLVAGKANSLNGCGESVRPRKRQGSAKQQHRQP